MRNKRGVRKNPSMGGRKLPARKEPIIPLAGKRSGMFSDGSLGFRNEGARSHGFNEDEIPSDEVFDSFAALEGLDTDRLSGIDSNESETARAIQPERKTDNQKENDSRFYIPFQVRANYLVEENIETPCFDRFVKMQSDECDFENARRRLLEYLGYLFVLDSDAKVFAYMGTATSSGKSVFSEFLMKYFDESAVTNLPLRDFGSRFGFGDIAEKCLGVSMEISEGKINPEAATKLKNITGDRRIHSEQKYLPVRSVRHNCKFFSAEITLSA